MKKKFFDFMDLSEINPFVEKNIELDKATLISRCAGHINYTLYQTLKVLVFFKIGKDNEGNLYIV